MYFAYRPFCLFEEAEVGGCSMSWGSTSEANIHELLNRDSTIKIVLFILASRIHQESKISHSVPYP